MTENPTADAVKPSLVEVEAFRPGAKDVQATAQPAAKTLPVVEHTDNTVTLETPIVRGSQIIASFTLRKPLGSDLRGLSLVDVSNMQQDALEVLLPRISDPMITNADVRRMDIVDLLIAGQVLTGFLLPRVKANSANS